MTQSRAGDSGPANSLPLPETSWAPQEAAVILKITNWGEGQGTEGEAGGGHNFEEVLGLLALDA